MARLRANLAGHIYRRPPPCERLDKATTRPIMISGRNRFLCRVPMIGIEIRTTLFKLPTLSIIADRGQRYLPPIHGRSIWYDTYDLWDCLFVVWQPNFSVPRSIADRNACSSDDGLAKLQNFSHPISTADTNKFPACRDIQGAQYIGTC